MTEIYYVGDLQADRRENPALDRKAEDYLERGTPIGVPTRPRLGDDSPRGRGEGVLTQKRLWPGVYEYRFTPVAGLDRRGPREDASNDERRA